MKRNQKQRSKERTDETHQKTLIIFLINRRYFATIFAISYAIFLVIFGAIAFVGNAVENQFPIPEVKRNEKWESHSS